MCCKSTSEAQLFSQFCCHFNADTGFPPSKDFLWLKQLFQFLSTKILGGNMQKTVIACCVGALFAAGTAAAATHEQDGKTGIAGEGSALTVNTQTQNVTDKSQLIGGWWHYTDLVTAETDLNHAGSTSDLTVDLTNEKQVDEIVGGNYIKQPTGLADKTHEATIVDLGFTMKPEANGPWTIGVGLKGYAGDRRGGTGSVNGLYKL